MRCRAQWNKVGQGKRLNTVDTQISFCKQDFVAETTHHFLTPKGFRKYGCFEIMLAVSVYKKQRSLSSNVLANYVQRWEVFYPKRSLKCVVKREIS